MQWGFVDQPSQRKIHRSPIPLLGGVAIYLGVLLTLFLYVGWSPLLLSILVGGTILLVTGLIDDRCKSLGKEFAVWPRLIIYIACSAVPIWFGIQIVGISNVTSSGMIIFSNWFSWLVTVLWIFGLMNMVNFIDGVDGLAPGIVSISALTLFVVALLKGQESSAVLAVAMVGSCAAFLMYNFHPAKIFMGDAGAVFLGYTLAVLSIDGALKGATFVSLGVALLALGVPILDTVIVFTRRLAENKGLHRADKLHTHHSLMKWGLTQTQTVSFLYLIGGVFSLLSIIIFLLSM